MNPILEKIQSNAKELSSSIAPDTKKVEEIVESLRKILFFQTTEEQVNTVFFRLMEQIDRALQFMKVNGNPKVDAERFFAMLPDIQKTLMTDIDAIYDGDPAAKSKSEIIICYPGFTGILTYRLAHALLELGVPLLPRMMSEYAHKQTGIDIHPGANIGHHFCIDHGTGVVIGETTVIGNYVKLYQGVTLGAKSFELDENGNPVKDIKRHPNIGNHVVIYANATILGGNTYIGDHCVIGGNVWLTHSVSEGQTIYYKECDSMASQGN